MGSSAKTGKKIFEGHRSTFCIKVPFGIGHPPTYTSNAVCMCAVGLKGGWGCPHMRAHAHACTHAQIHVKHDNFNCKWQPPLGESLGTPYDVICTCVCMCTYVGGTLSPPPPPINHPPLTRGNPQN